MEYQTYVRTLNVQIPLRQTHCFTPNESGLNLAIKHIENCFSNLAKDAPRGAIKELQQAIIEISKMAPLVSPSIEHLGGGISENLKQGEKVGNIEKTHLVINRIMKEIASKQNIQYIDVGTDYHYPFYNDYDPTLKAKECIKNNIDSITHYPSSYGLVELRQAFSHFMECEFDIKLDYNTEIMVATGASQIFDAVSRAFAGEYFIIPELALPTVSTIAVSNGAKPIRIPLNKQTGFINLSYLEKKIQELNYPSIRFMYINNPTNPDGKVANIDTLSDIIKFCKNHNILLIHDMDSWRTIHNSEKKLVNLLQIEDGRNIGITIFSVSKEFGLPGLRVGLVAGNKQLINAIRLHNSLFSVMLPELSQYAVINALNEYCKPDSDNKTIINRKITDILNYCIREWGNLGWDGENIIRPDGGFKFLLKVPPKFIDCGNYNKAELFVYHVVKETKIKLSNSTSFNPDNSEYIRMIVMQNLNVMRELFNRLHNAGINYNMDMPSNLAEDYDCFLKQIKENTLNDF